MDVFFKIDNRNFRIEVDDPLDISIPLIFGGDQPNAFGVERAVSAPCRAGNLIGDTRSGGSCNFEQITFIPHCNGTHTECVGHITHERISVRDSLTQSFIPSTLISIEPVDSSETTETYPVNSDEKENLITRKSLEKVLENSDKNFLEGLIVRTLPNDESKKSRFYTNNQTPFFSTEAMRFIVEKGVKHLLVDLPSIDRANDQGKLSNHRAFWNVESGSFAVNEKSFINRTITEMIFVPDSIKVGSYLLNLQITAFVADASPSRPLLFKIIEESKC